MDSLNVLERSLERKQNEIAQERNSLIQFTKNKDNIRNISSESILLDGDDATSGSIFLTNAMRARQRNQKILEELRELKKSLDAATTAKKKHNADNFTLLKNNYWSMVKSVYPIWQKELDEYRRRKQTKY